MYIFFRTVFNIANKMCTFVAFQKRYEIMSKRYTITAALPYTQMDPSILVILAGVYVPADIYSTIFND